MPIDEELDVNGFSGGQRLLLDSIRSWLHEHPEINCRLYEKDKEVMDGRYHSWILEIPSCSLVLQSFMFSGSLSIRKKETSFTLDTTEERTFRSTPEANEEVVRDILSRLDSALTERSSRNLSPWRYLKQLFERSGTR